MLKNIIIAKNVVLNPVLRRTLIAIDPHFEQCQCICTSGVRTAEHQLQIIFEKCKDHKINNEIYPEFFPSDTRSIDTIVDVDGMKIYWWARAWSKLLEIGEIVNPPLAAQALFDYLSPSVEDGKTINKKGRIIDISPHMRGLSFDLARHDENLNLLVERIKFCKEKPQCFINSYRPEPNNNGKPLHVDVCPI